MTNSWDEKFIGLCNHIKEWSKDESTKVGAVIVNSDNAVISMGYNGMPRWVKDNKPERHERPNKYYYFEHAERNAMYNAASIGATTKDCKLYVPWQPCADCSRGIIQCQITEVILETWDIPERWETSCGIGGEMLTEAGILVRTVKNS